MKKILAVIISLALMFSNLVVFADDYSNHWSASSVKYLMEKGIVSGDSYGNMNPEAYITRAEFAKVINRVFGYSDTSGEQFPDVSSDKWYFNEMKTARNAGYMLGDANGKANPEKAITRAEVCVIYSRILDLNVNNINTGFADDSEIPEWAKGAVCAMKNSDLIKGYSDNTFKADKSMKRSEAFTIVAGQMQKSAPSEESAPVVNVTGTSSNAGFSTGGGGGGGGGYTPPASGIISSPLNLRWDKDDYTIRWASVPNATGYEVKVELITAGTQLSLNHQPETVTETSYNIRTIIENLMNTDTEEKRMKQEVFRISVCAKNISGISAPAVLESVAYNNEFIEFPQFEFEQSYVNNVETMKFKWDNNENADYYKLEIDFAGDGSYELIGDSEIRNGVAELTPEQIDKISGSYNMRVTAPSKHPNKVLSLNAQVTTVELPLYGGKSEGYNLVYNARHFNNIKMNASENFRIMQDISLDNPQNIPTLSGKMDGNGKSITFANLTTPLVGSLTGTIENLNLYGNAELTGANTGALVGVINGGMVRNCANNAIVTLNSSYSGGMIGRNLSGTITGCKNYGDIISNASSTGAIVGESNNVINKCSNYGKLTINNSTSAHGGIIGMHQSTTTISECANYGDIITTGNATKVGGIAGEYRGASANAFKNCFNSGNINVGAGAGIAGGILASIPHENYDNLSLTNCYNTGKIIIGGVDTTNENSIYHSFADGVEGTKIINSYYLISGDTSEKEGTYGLTEAEFKLESSFDDFDFAELWKIDDASGYPYPQLITNPYITAPEKLETPSFTDGKLPYNDGTNVEFYISVPTQSSKISVSVESNGETINQEITGTGNSEYTVKIPSSMFTVDSTYSVSIKALGNGETYFDSDEFSFDYTHKKFMLRAPELNLNWYFDNADTAVWDDECYRISWLDVEETGGINVNKYKVEINGSEVITTDLYYDIIPSQFTENSITVKVSAMYDDEVVSGTAEKNVDLLFAGKETVDNVNYILIGNERQLGNISNTTLNYKLSNDFTVSNLPAFSEFSGVFDGNGKTVYLNNITSPLFVQLNASAKVINLVFDGSATLSGTNIAMIAKVNFGLIENCINYADFSINGAYSGGFVGNNHGPVNNCINYGDCILYSSSTSAMIGENYSTITNCTNYGNISIPNSSQVHGGIVARYQTTSTISHCANFGDITATGNASLVGGIAGEFRGSNTVGFEDCFNAGNITVPYGAGIAGGIFSTLPHENYDNVTIKNCYNVGTITVGGIDMTNFSSVYFNVTSGAEGTTIINCYYLISGESEGKAGSTGLTSDEMKNKDNFSGFDFENVWQIPTDGTYLYPIFR